MTHVQEWRVHIPPDALKVARIGVITDVDGTVSPIVSQPDAATVTPKNRELLQALQEKLTLVAVVSGRAAADVHDRVGIPDLVYVGNHGLERWVGDGVEIPDHVKRYRPQMQAVRDLIKERTLPGMMVEDKVATLSVHYRNTENPEAAAGLFHPVITAISEKHGLRVHEGRMIFEVRPPLDINKGTALRALVEDYQLETAFYLGDDVTDVDALNMARHLRETGVCHGVAVGVESADDDTPPSVRQASDFLVSGVEGVEAFFDWLLMALSASSN